MRPGAIVDGAGNPVPIVTSAQADQTFRGRWISDVSTSYKFTRFSPFGFNGRFVYALIGYRL